MPPSSLSRLTDSPCLLLWGRYLGDGPKLVRELFRVAEEHSPTIIFMDEIDAVGAKRYDSQSGGTKEIQRTMLELLNQLDGFDEHSEVKVIMATNKIETLDPALIRPGRIDRKIEFPLPDIKTKRHIFGIHTGRMTLSEEVDLEVFVMAKDELSGADIKAVCTEAGLLALRERRMKVSRKYALLPRFSGSPAYSSFERKNSRHLNAAPCFFPMCPEPMTCASLSSPLSLRSTLRRSTGDAGRLRQGERACALPQEGQRSRGPVPLMGFLRAWLVSYWFQLFLFCTRWSSPPTPSSTSLF